jgi:hypothetical protein
LGLGPYKRYEFAEAAEHLSLDQGSVAKLVDANELGSLKVGRHIFVLGGHIVRWKAARDAATSNAAEQVPEGRRRP